MQRVQKIMSNNGYCSRRKAEDIIADGRVKVNGKTISLGDKASNKDEITIDGKPLKKNKKIYLLFNKPVGCVTALTDPEHKTIMDFIDIKERIYPVGRLDYNTSGLIILTNDGDLANKIMHPSNEIEKTYLAELTTPMTKKDADHLSSGVMLSDGITHPAKVRRDYNFVEITIHEGRNRIVRRMLKNLYYGVKTLERTGIGNIKLNLNPGEYKRVTKKDIENHIYKK